MSFKFHSNIPKAKAKLKENEFRALKAVGEFVEAIAAMNTPVDLGNLRASIAHEVDASGMVKGVYIGTNIEYAIYVEKGTGIYAEDGNGRKGGWVYQDPKDDEWYFTYGQEPQPYLTPAFEDNRQAIKQILRKNLGEGL